MLKNAIVSLSDNGTITDISVSDDIDRLAGVEFYSGILVPGFVNAHCHLELSHIKGAIAEGGGFTEFARQMGQVRNRFSEQQRADAVSLTDARMWAEGISVVADICNGATTFDTKKLSPIHYHSFLELYGLQTDTLDALMPSVAKARELNIPYSITPHSIYSLNDVPFALAVRGASGQSDAPLSVHFMESDAEGELFDRRGELWKWYAERGMETDFTDYASPADRIISQIPSNRKIMLIHNCCVTSEDVDKIMAHFGDNVTWVLCPGSNDYISRIAPPVELLRRKGVRIAVGTDSFASNRALSMVDELKHFSGVPMEELFEWASANGARAMGLDDKYGAFEVGLTPGGVLITGIDWDNMSLTDDSKAQRIF